MSNVEVIMVAIGSGLAYSILIGVTWAMLPSWNRDEPPRTFAALLWPVALPVVLGVRITERLLRPRSALPKATAKERA